MEEYKSNSYKSREERSASTEKKLEKVISGKAKTRPKSEIRKLADIFLAEDIASVKTSIFEEVFVPAVKKALYDIVTTAADMILYAGKAGDRRSPTASRFSYGSCFDSKNNLRREPGPIRAGGGNVSFEDVIFDRRSDAEVVLTAMEEAISQFGAVTFGDYYDLAQVSTNNYAINKYGWRDLRPAQIIQVRDGWMIKLPKAILL